MSRGTGVVARRRSRGDFSQQSPHVAVTRLNRGVRQGLSRMSAESRDDFPESAKRALSARVNAKCSNPDCGAATSGPQLDPCKALNVGVAAHIAAAAPGGPRYDPA